MKGCPFCEDFKKMLEEQHIDFYERDIDVHKKEYDTYSEITENDMVPALLIIEAHDDELKTFLYAPERNYNELTEAVDLINQHRKNIGII